ncbi:glycosyltransferase [Christiangramia echinicola]|uniref:Glycosyl transferase family 2 n=1 Tax=Christiangramia echinicola TaxID=279359 RepID=A0A1H1QP10_9FLAO|nr:glycosyltransferase [Christiangramia echinicola]SDS25210.1 Glycosyl transferase family 2 [Christiangramia echinicola]
MRKFESEPVISVCMITYNHETYIEDAINGILAQEFYGKIELVISNDHSSDRTNEVITDMKESIERKNISLKYYNQLNNIGVMANFVFALKSCTGKYIAICEGDDYWTDPFKLQRQHDLLENNKQYSACFTNAKILDGITQQEYLYCKFSMNQSFDLQEIVLGGGGLFPTASWVIRNCIKDWPNFIFKYRSGDRAVSLLLLDHGNFFYLDEVTCIYRIQSGGVFSSIKDNVRKRNDITKENIKLLKDFNSYYNFKYDTVFKKAISQLSKKVLLRDRSLLFSSNSLKFLQSLNFKDSLSLFKNLI